MPGDSGGFGGVDGGGDGLVQPGHLLDPAVRLAGQVDDGDDRAALAVAVLGGDLANAGERRAFGEADLSLPGPVERVVRVGDDRQVGGAVGVRAQHRADDGLRRVPARAVIQVRPRSLGRIEQPECRIGAGLGVAAPARGGPAGGCVGRSPHGAAARARAGRPGRGWPAGRRGRRGVRCGAGPATRAPAATAWRTASRSAPASSMTSASARPVRRRCSPPSTAQIRSWSAASNSSRPPPAR